MDAPGGEETTDEEALLLTGLQPPFLQRLDKLAILRYLLDDKNLALIFLLLLTCITFRLTAENIFTLLFSAKVKI